MSEGVDLGDFRDAFVGEARELLENANREALAIEGALRDGSNHSRAVRELFRAVHTIKGLASMVRVEPIVALSHGMEESLRAADRNGTPVSPAALDALFAALRAVEQRVRAVAEHADVPEPPAQLLSTLQSSAPTASFVATGENVESIVQLEESLIERLTPRDRQQLVAATSEGSRALRLDFVPTPELAGKGIGITTLRERLANVAEIVRVLPVSTPASEATPSGLLFVVLFTTTHSDEEIVNAAGIPVSAPKSIVDVRQQAAAPVEDELLRHDSVRVDVARLDATLDRLSELVVTRHKMSLAVAKLAAQGVDVRELSQIIDENARQLRALRTSVLAARTVPVSDLFARLRLLVRGLERASGKRIRLVLDAGNAELDNGVAELVFPAIVHLVRNAIDHGIEAPKERERGGKSPEAMLEVRCRQISSTALDFSVKDDGRGVDGVEAARRARREAPRDDVEMLEVLCLPGLSTRDEADATSGRGMGMDIVRKTIVERLGGELRMHTERQQGTHFTMRVPLSIAIVDAVIIRCADQRFVVPNTVVDETFPVEQRLVRFPPNRRRDLQVGVLAHRDGALPIVRLADVLRLPNAGAAQQALVVRRREQPFAFAVDRILTQQEIVVRPLEDALIRVNGINGATDLGDGKPTLVLDLPRLAAALTMEGDAA
jgi:two-component system chemotaxis sensor kinase CheA